MNDLSNLTPEQRTARQRKLQRIKKRRRRKMFLRCGGLLCVLIAIVVLVFWGLKPADTSKDPNTTNPADPGDPLPTPSPTENQGPEILRNVQLPDWVDVQIIPVNESGRRGVALEDINDIVIHYVGNAGTTAQQNRDYFAQKNTTVSSHFLIGLDGEVIQCVPLNEKSSASNHRNRDTISIEVCHPDETGKFEADTYASLIKLTAWLCDLCGFDSQHVIRHYDVTGKECPLYFVNNEDAWTAFLADVESELTAK